MGVGDPSGKVFDAALDLMAIGHGEGDMGELCARAGHHTAAERGQGGSVPGTLAFWLPRIPLAQGSLYGTILAEVVTHRLLLLVYGSLNLEYTMRQPLTHPFQNGLKKVSGSEIVHLDF